MNHIHYGILSASVVSNYVRNSHKPFVEHSATFHIGTIQHTIHSAQFHIKSAENLWRILNPFSLIYIGHFLLKCTSTVEICTFFCGLKCTFPAFYVRIPRMMKFVAIM